MHLGIWNENEWTQWLGYKQLLKVIDAQMQSINLEKQNSCWGSISLKIYLHKIMCKPPLTSNVQNNTTIRRVLHSTMLCFSMRIQACKQSLKHAVILYMATSLWVSHFNDFEVFVVFGTSTYCGPKQPNKWTMGRSHKNYKVFLKRTPTSSQLTEKVDAITFFAIVMKSPQSYQNTTHPMQCTGYDAQLKGSAFEVQYIWLWPQRLRFNYSHRFPPIRFKKPRVWPLDPSH